MPIIKPGGFAGEQLPMVSQQLQGMMLTELLGAWPSDAWREAGKATAGNE